MRNKPVVNVGVFPCGSEVGLEIFRSLKYNSHFHLIGLNSGKDKGELEYENYIGDLPFFTEKSFVSRIKHIISQNNIQYLIPTMDEVGYFLKKIETLLECEVVYPELKVAKIIRRKSTTYLHLKKSIQTPVVYNDFLYDEINFPVFVKPDIGYGSKGSKLVYDYQELKSLVFRTEKLIIMEFLPGKEFTVECFSDLNGNLLYFGARERLRIKMGISVSTRISDNQEFFKEIAERISSRLKIKGIWFFQIKKDKLGQLKLLEVAGRVSGSMALHRSLGINFIALDLYQRMGEKIEIQKTMTNNYVLQRSLDCKIKMDLDFDTVYCDLDDCLIINEKINFVLVGFLFNCFNKGKKIILLTKHSLNLEERLKKFRLNLLFDEIIHIKSNYLLKSSFITEKRSIFIDDSFSERIDVFRKVGIPTFAPDCIEFICFN